MDGSSSSEFRGYYKREHSLIRPYQGAGMEVCSLWEIMGSTIVSQQQIRLTADIQSLKGAIWNKVPCHARDWEIQVNFKVHGSTGTLFGDGLAIWYVQEPYQLGEVFGSKDYFRGLAVFLDTYSNHNGPHSHSHPYITAMVNNGSLHYDHDSDGTHTSLGGEHSGCEAKHSHNLHRYCPLATTLVSATTGELSDNHDIHSIRTFEQEFTRVERQDEADTNAINPEAQNIAAPRDHIQDKRPSNLGGLAPLCSSL
uniref:L-type lectin-like domain-containing protein n=1 Tax=Ditylenchus dipsaci TaxID=166011 RepID=A0A915CY95_9BILA